MRRARESYRRQRGFTLIELMVVVAIIGALAAIAIPAFSSQQGKAFDARVKEDARNAAAAQEAYFLDNASYYSGDCGNLPGFSGSAGVNCTAAASGPNSFAVQTSHPSANLVCVWANDASPNLKCT